MAALFCLFGRSVVVFFFFFLRFSFFPVISHQPPVDKDERVALFQFLHHANASFPRRTSAAYVVTCEFSKGDELWPYARITGLSFRCDSDSNPSLPTHSNSHFHSSNFSSLKFLSTDFISNCFNDETRAVSLSDSEPSLPGHSNPQFHSFNLISFKSLRRVFFSSCFNEEKQAAPLSNRTPGPTFPPALEELVLIDNPGLAGNLSDIFHNCPKLRRVVLTGNGLHGEIPEGWGNNLVHLEELTLSRNQLSGKVPSNLAKLKNLTVLDLRDNKLEGSLPLEFARFASVCEINLENNNLSGKVPFCVKIGGKLKLDGNSELCAEKGPGCSLGKLKACPSEAVIPNAFSFAGGSNPLLGILILGVFICFLILHVV